MSELYKQCEEDVKALMSKDIDYPRFQRRNVWDKDPKKLFKFCISIYKGYPIGILTFQKQVSEDNTTYRLLDGRQRYSALTDMYDPENIWRWASKTLKRPIKEDGKKKQFTKMSPDEIEEKFWEYMNDYIEYSEESTDKDEEVIKTIEKDSDELTIDDFDDQGISDEDDDSCSGGTKTSSSNNGALSQSMDDLKKLLRLIVAVHPVRKETNGLTKPFLVKKSHDIPYITYDSNGKPESIRYSDFIKWIKSIGDISKLDKIKEDAIIQWFPEKCRECVKEHVYQHYESMINSIREIKILENSLNNYKVSYIELNEKCTDADAKKIFELINTGGTPLTTPEILSSKISWNIPVDNPAEGMVDDRNKLYDTIGKIEKMDDIVRWDVAATFTDRIPTTMNFVFGNWSEYKEKELESKITIGFKVMSGYYAGSISKTKMSELADRSNKHHVNWDSPEVEVIMSEVGDALLKDKFFRMVDSWYRPSWKNSLMKITTEAVSYNFFLNVARSWKKYGRPKQGKKYDEFIVDAIKLFDRSVYEYVTRQWSGSSDSKISKNLDDPTYLDKYVENEAWSMLITEMFDSLTIAGNKYADKENYDKGLVTAILYYYYILNGVEPPRGNGLFEVDHIIPQRLFKDTSEYHKYKNAIFNLEFLSESANGFKKDIQLSKIDDPAIMAEIERYGDVPRDKFCIINNPCDYKELYDLRKAKFIKTFGLYRERTIEGRFFDYN